MFRLHSTNYSRSFRNSCLPFRWSLSRLGSLPLLSLHNIRHRCRTNGKCTCYHKQCSRNHRTLGNQIQFRDDTREWFHTKNSWRVQCSQFQYFFHYMWDKCLRQGSSNRRLTGILGSHDWHRVHRSLVPCCCSLSIQDKLVLLNKFHWKNTNNNSGMVPIHRQRISCMLVRLHHHLNNLGNPLCGNSSDGRSSTIDTGHWLFLHQLRCWCKRQNLHRSLCKRYRDLDHSCSSRQLDTKRTWLVHPNLGWGSISRHLSRRLW